MIAPHSLALRGSTVLLGTFIATAASAQSMSAASEGPWRYGATLYFYVPTVTGKTSVPADSGGTAISFDVLEHLKFTVMGALEAHNGQWGAFTDFIYLDFAANRNQTRKFTIGDIGLPVGTTADVDWSFKGISWTVGGQYRFVSSPGFTLDALGGARWLDIRRSNDWTITGDIGPLDPVRRSGSSKKSETLVDGIVGLRGRVALGADSPWSVPFYVDVGTGESQLTWQAAAGIRYAFQWGEISALWRVLDYDMKSGDPIEKLRFNGPMVGATWRW